MARLARLPLEPQPQAYSTRLSRCGALVPDLRLLTTLWRSDVARDVLLAGVGLSHLGPLRAHELVQCAFLPRFVRSEPPDLWRTLAVLERAEWSVDRIRPLHFYATALAEPILADVVIEKVHPLYASGRTELAAEDIVAFIDSRPDRCFPRGRWNALSTRRIATALLTVLRDFGLLEGLVKKRLVPIALPLPSFAVLARARYEAGGRGLDLLRDRVWSLFRLGETGVERLFMEAHQHGFLAYHAAGSLIRVDFPADDLEGYAHTLAARAD